MIIKRTKREQNTSTNHIKMVSYSDDDELVTSTVPPLQGVALDDYKSTLDSLMSYRAVVSRFLGEDSSGKIEDKESLADLWYEVEKSILHVDPFRIWIVLCVALALVSTQEKVSKLPLSMRKYPWVPFEYISLEVPRYAEGKNLTSGQFGQSSVTK
jgi:hypothetical protein